MVEQIEINRKTFDQIGAHTMPTNNSTIEPVKITGTHGRVTVRLAPAGTHAGSIRVRLTPTTPDAFDAAPSYGPVSTAFHGTYSFHTRSIDKALRCAQIFVDAGGTAFRAAWFQK